MRSRFRLLVHESTGQKYQDLFSKIMTHADHSFQPVKSHGNIGDRGNDGWCQSSGKYFQVYAPEELPNNTDSAKAKAKDDLAKLIKHWNGISKIKEYYFVVNDKFKGVSPHISELMNELKESNNLEKASVFLSSDLENLLFSLEDDFITSVIGSAKEVNLIYAHLIENITKKMFLSNWSGISENLIARGMEAIVLEGFNEAALLVFKTSMPNSIPSLESSIRDVADRAVQLVRHFTYSEQAALTDDGKFWQQDMRWKGTWMNNQDEYHAKYKIYDDWRKTLNRLHSNMVHSLNIFSDQVRSHVDQNYLMGKQFTIVDCLGTYNNLEGYEAIPRDFID